MRSVIVNVGPLASASANNICTSQSPASASTLALNGTLCASSFVGTGSIAGNVLTITAVTSGTMNIGYAINGVNVPANLMVIGLGPNTTNGIGTYVLNQSSATVSSTTIYGNTTATLDMARRVSIASAANDSGITFTITGTDWASTPIAEVVTGANAAAASSVLDYLTVTSIVTSGATASTVTVGTNSVAGSPWVRFDEYALGPVGAQFSVSGTANYTLQTTYGAEPSTSAYARSLIVWDTSGSPIIGNTATATVSLATAPRYARVLLNSGSGSITASFTQYGVAPY